MHNQASDFTPYKTEQYSRAQILPCPFFFLVGFLIGGGGEPFRMGSHAPGQPPPPKKKKQKQACRIVPSRRLPALPNTWTVPGAGFQSGKQQLLSFPLRWWLGAWRVIRGFPIWVWLKIKQEGRVPQVWYPCFHLPGQPILEFRFFEFATPIYPLRIRGKPTNSGLQGPGTPGSL